MKKLLLLILVSFAFNHLLAQITLGPSPYSQDFNSIGTSLPVGITVRASSTATALGTVQAYSPTAIAWNITTGAVKNFASGTDLPSSATPAQQSSSTNRSLGIRQTGSLGDPGGSFVVQLANTSGLSNFKLSFKLQSLDITSPRLTTWRVDYGFGPTPSTFTTATATGTLTTGGSSFTNNPISVDFGSSLDNRPDDVWIRIVTLTASTGSGNRTSSAIDDLSLTYSSGTAPSPSFNVSPSSIAFGNQAVGTTSAARSYTLSCANLDGSNVTLSTSSPFSISKSATGPFSTNLIFTSLELNDSSTIVFSQFSPTATGPATGTITHTGGGVSGTTTVSLTGNGINLNPVATNDTFGGLFGNLISGDVSSNDTDPQSLSLTFSKLTDPQNGTLIFNNNGTFSYQSVEGSAASQTFSYRVTNTIGLSADATVTITLAEKTKIFISQYYEGTSTNKWIELTNPTDSPVNTTSPQLKLALYTISGDAGNIVITATPSQIANLTITIPPKSSVLIGNTGNGAEVPYLTAASAQQSNNAVINFNGNDGVALLDAANNIIDAFGTGVNAKDVSYVRNQDALTPSASFIVSDWSRVPLATVQNAADLDDPNRLGAHVQPEVLPCTTPTSQPSALTFSAVGTKSITLNFTASVDASEYLIVRSLNDSLTSAPVDSIIYNTGSNLGGGTVAGRVSTVSFIDNNLLPGTTYHYFIFALNSISCNGGPKYLNSNPLSGTQATIPLPVCSTPTSQPTNFRITFSNYNVIQGAFDASSADEFLVVMSQDSTLNSLPIDQTVYSVGDTIGGGIVIKRGAQTSFNRSGLAQNTRYFFFVFVLNSNCSGGPLYLTSSPLTGNQKTGIFNSNSLNYYFGNLHSHSSYSDGNKDDTTKKPEDDYAFAKNSRKMDFLGISEHNHTQAGMRLANWQPGIQAARNATTSNFIAMHGMEWGVISGGGHVVVYGIDSLIGWEPGEYQIFVQKSTYTGPNGLFNIINRHGLNAIATLAHPNFTDFNNIGAGYNALADSAVVGSALESGPAFSTNVTYSDPPSSMSYLDYYNLMLSRGYHLGANLDHDNHNMTFGRHTRGRTVVLAPALSENDILDAMKKMRFYASEDSAARISFTLNDRILGSQFAGNGIPRISISGSTTHPMANITIMHGVPGSGIFATPLASSSTGTLSYSDTTLTNLSTGYYYADITETDGSRIITSPIWYTRNDSIKNVQLITFNSIPTATYGDPDIDPSATSSNPTIPIIYTSSDTTVATIVANKVHIRKAGSVIITANQAGNSLFIPAVPKSQTLNIVPKAVTVFANAKSKIYGSSDSTLTYTVVPPLVNGDTSAGTLTRDAGENVGSYVIRQGTLSLSSNYTLNFDTAVFIITKRELIVKADDKTKIYGTHNPVFTASYQGFVNGDSSSVFTSQPVFFSSATDTSSVGLYTTIVSGASALNYSMTFISGVLTITPASQFIAFDSIAAKTFGDADFALIASGGNSGNPVIFVSADTAVASISGVIVHIKRAGTTLITASQNGNQNYTAAVNVSRMLIVNKATATITLSNLSYTYDGTPKSVTVTTNPLGLTTVTVTYNDSLSAPSAPGSYAVVASLNNPN
ncbi:MAG TPA: MBG domain-containing protein, partial [Cyclobacteriaceae bacterium]|nr:MBG domain-containing protein [Cyclobacteriaceae bacterium]